MQLHINDSISGVSKTVGDYVDGESGVASGASKASKASKASEASITSGARGASRDLIDFIAQIGIKVLIILGQINDEVGVTLVNDADIHQMNLEHRGIDAPTDVLSFPLDDFDMELSDTDTDMAMYYNECDMALELDELELEPESKLTGMPHLVGDVVISVERAVAQSIEYGHSLQREVGFLLIHGLLHLYGYDHIDEQDRIAMRDEEERILAELGLGRDIPETPHTS